MKQSLAIFLAALLGSVVGALAMRLSLPGPDSIRTHDFVLLNEENKPAARLSSKAGKTILEFLDASGRQSVELRSEGTDSGLLFHGSDSRAVVALVSTGRLKQSTLYLGDEIHEGRVAIGAMQTDVPADDVGDWGVTIRRPNSLQTPFEVHVQEEPEGVKAWMRVQEKSLP